MLIRNIVRTLPIPHEPGNSITIRKIARKQARKASETRQEQAIGRVRDLGGPAFVREIQELNSAKDAGSEPDQQKDEAVDDPLFGMDEDALLATGLVGWDGPCYPEAFSVEAIDQLDDVTATWAAKQIVALHRGTLDEDDRKND